MKGSNGLQICHYPAAVLTESARQATLEHHKARMKVIRMILLMEDLGGVGIAAPQVGWPVRVAVIAHRFAPPCLRAFAWIFYGRSEAGVVLVNPVITYKRKPILTEVEGCLSLPDRKFEVDRECELRMQFEGKKGKVRSVYIRGYASRIIQHELDHLDGILICNRGKEVVGI